MIFDFTGLISNKSALLFTLCHKKCYCKSATGKGRKEPAAGPAPEWHRGPGAMKSGFPVVAAILANAHGAMLNLRFVFLRGENFDDQGRDCKYKPLDGPPPPADEQPPEQAVVNRFQIGFRYHLDIYIFASAFRTFHFSILSFQYVQLNGHII